MRGAYFPIAFIAVQSKVSPFHFHVLSISIFTTNRICVFIFLLEGEINPAGEKHNFRLRLGPTKVHSQSLRNTLGRATVSVAAGESLPRRAEIDAGIVRSFVHNAIVIIGESLVFAHGSSIWIRLAMGDQFMRPSMDDLAAFHEPVSVNCCRLGKVTRIMDGHRDFWLVVCGAWQRMSMVQMPVPCVVRQGSVRPGSI